MAVFKSESLFTFQKQQKSFLFLFQGKKERPSVSSGYMFPVYIPNHGHNTYYDCNWRIAVHRKTQPHGQNQTAEPQGDTGARRCIHRKMTKNEKGGWIQPQVLQFMKRRIFSAL